jgi:hypothetical protein
MRLPNDSRTVLDIQLNAFECPINNKKWHLSTPASCSLLLLLLLLLLSSSSSSSAAAASTCKQ